MLDSTKLAIARRITERRMELGLSQDELAMRMAIKQSSVSVAECEGVSTLAAVQRWAEALDCNPVWLAYGAGTAKKEPKS